MKSSILNIKLNKISTFLLFINVYLSQPLAKLIQIRGCNK